MSPPFRFLVDEASWGSLASLDNQVIDGVLNALVDRIQLALSRRERVGKSIEIWEFPAGEKEKVHDLVFGPGGLERDTKLRVSRALDQLPNWDEEEELTVLDCEINGESILAPSVGWAYLQAEKRLAVALLPLTSAGRNGPVAVTVQKKNQELHFVTSEVEHVGFFRDAMVVENVDESEFENLAYSAFPSLFWADGVFSGLSDFSRPFLNVRADLIRHLGALSDHGAQVFCELLSTAPDQIDARLSSLGAPCSDENGKTKSHAKACEVRTRTFEGKELTFFWHSKLEPNVDRIHFLYDPEGERIIVGIFTRHCKMPDDF